MEVEENHVCKRSRLGNGTASSSQAARIGCKAQHQDDDDEDGEGRGGGGATGETFVMPWHHPSSRIFRVSRASGGKDRHSKVYTAKGLRDRRVRLSVSTAIQFYDLQDRLGFDQPSKAIEWLIKAAAAAINELPALVGTFPEVSKPYRPEEKLPEELDVDAEPSFNQKKQLQQLEPGGDDDGPAGGCLAGGDGKRRRPTRGKVVAEEAATAGDSEEAMGGEKRQCWWGI